MKEYYIYIMATGRNGTLYSGVTSNLTKRVWEHKTNHIRGFTSKYNVKQLVYYEIYTDILEAISREKQIKKWRRSWKLSLIEKRNPQWKDLFSEIV